ncbi:MAG: bestrophin family ion channel [Bacteroidota bacterium]|nr:bestrophin family ion channel [Bacteroidota bacterium]
MIIYNPKDWWKLIFAFHKSDTFRKMMPGIIGMAILTGIIAYLEKEVFHVNFKNTTTIHALVGFVLSLLLVFRTNSAYDRWWEGRKIWGSFVNNSRNLALKLSELLTDTQDKKRFNILINNYIFASKEHLRNGVKAQDLQSCDKYTVSEMMNGQHVPNMIMKFIYREIYALLDKKIISHEMLITLNPELQSFTDNLGACERIKKTPIPYSYNIFLKKVLFIYIASMPFGFAMEFGYWSILIVSLLFYIFGSIELIAEEIEDPFGRDDNDLPTDEITKNIAHNLNEILV